MKNAVELFSALGVRLRNFGQDASSQEVIACACRANGWFTPTEIRRAVAALASEMLTPEKLTLWLAAYEVPVLTPRRVLVVMAGNIPLVGFFDLLCVVAAGHRCLVKPSAKDTAMMEYVVGLLRELDPHVAVEFYDGTGAVDAVIATGSDNAVRYFRSQYAGIPSLLRGSRMSVAVLSGCETPEQLTGLADDIWAYSGLGCRNVSFVFLPEGCGLKLEMPDVNKRYVNNYRQSKALLTMTGKPFVDLGAAVAVEQREFPRELSELTFSHYKNLDEVTQWLAEHDSEIQCVVAECIGHSRRVGFGKAQSPALTDYPDECDIISFLVLLT